NDRQRQAALQVSQRPRGETRLWRRVDGPVHGKWSRGDQSYRSRCLTQASDECPMAASGRAPVCVFAIRFTVIDPFTLAQAPTGDPAATAGPTGYNPADLIAAYKLPTTGGVGQTVAIVDAFDDPNAESDLAVYRSTFGLPPCTTANGCFRKVNQTGGTKYPRA